MTTSNCPTFQTNPILRSFYEPLAYCEEHGYELNPSGSAAGCYSYAQSVPEQVDGWIGPDDIADALDEIITVILDHGGHPIAAGWFRTGDTWGVSATYRSPFTLKPDGTPV